jgi:glutathione S-transferase
MIVVHHLDNSRSQRVLWLLEELGIPYEIQRYQRDARTMLAPPELRKVHPLGKSPVITDDGRVIAESGAIIDYIIERHGGGRLAPPPGSDARLRYNYWLHYAEGSAMPPLLLKLVFDRLENGPVPFLVRPVVRAIARQVKRAFVAPFLQLHLDYMESELGQNEWFAGNEFTAADIQLSFPLEAAALFGGLDESRPRLHAFLERIHSRPAYRRALERGGQYDFGPR